MRNFRQLYCVTALVVHLLIEGERITRTFQRVNVVVRVWLEINVDVLAASDANAHWLVLWSCPLDGRCLADFLAAACHTSISL